jgi:hypothetical protein
MEYQSILTQIDQVYNSKYDLILLIFEPMCLKVAEDIPLKLSFNINKNYFVLLFAVIWAIINILHFVMVDFI